jgi:hypothetical protein
MAKTGRSRRPQGLSASTSGILRGCRSEAALPVSLARPPDRGTARSASFHVLAPGQPAQTPIGAAGQPIATVLVAVRARQCIGSRVGQGPRRASTSWAYQGDCSSVKALGLADLAISFTCWGTPGKNRSKNSESVMRLWA